MNRKLLVVHPSHCVEVYFDQQLTIGRDVYNSLCLQDAEVSRSHAIIFEQEDDVIVRDLKSRNGIYVNGEKVVEQVLRPGDELILGASVLIYQPPEGMELEGALSKRGRHLIEKRSKAGRGMPSEPMTIFSAAEMDGAIDKLLTEGAETTFLSLTNTVMLLQALNAMDRAADARELFQTTLESAFRIVGGHRGVVMEIDPAREHMKVRALRGREESTSVVIGEPILHALLEGEKCLFCANVLRDRRYSKMAARASRAMQGFVAVPIRSREELLGLIYLDSEDQTYQYNFSSLRSLYLLASHTGALLRRRPMHFERDGAPAASAARPS